jgi:ABC-type phosphate transport system permease subunit
MEQFDTDEKLVENSKDKKEKSSFFHCFIIIACCIVALCLIFAVFKFVKKANQEEDENLVNHSNLFFINFFNPYRKEISSINC